MARFYQEGVYAQAKEIEACEEVGERRPDGSALLHTEDVEAGQQRAL
jgi:hypothetical protein